MKKTTIEILGNLLLITLLACCIFGIVTAVTKLQKQQENKQKNELIKVTNE